MVRTGVTFADACDEYLRYVAVDLDRKPSTVCERYLARQMGGASLEAVDVAGDRSHHRNEVGAPKTRPLFGTFWDPVGHRLRSQNEKSARFAGAFECPRQESNLEPSD